MKGEEELVVTRVSNPYFVGDITPHLIRYVKKLEPMGITYESLYAYFVNSIQYGTEKSELCVVHKEGEREVLGFAHWHVMNMPHVGTVLMDHIYNDTTNRKVVRILFRELIEFANKKRCKFMMGMALNEKLVKHWRRVAREIGVTFRETPMSVFRFWKERKEE